MTNIVEASESTEPDPSCNTCGHHVDAHEDGGACQETGCDCGAYGVFVPEDDDIATVVQKHVIQDEDEPIPETRGPV